MLLAFLYLLLQWSSPNTHYNRHISNILEYLFVDHYINLNSNVQRLERQSRLLDKVFRWTLLGDINNNIVNLIIVTFPWKNKIYLNINNQYQWILLHSPNNELSILTIISYDPWMFAVSLSNIHSNLRVASWKFNQTFIDVFP